MLRNIGKTGFTMKKTSVKGCRLCSFCCQSIPPHLWGFCNTGEDT